MTRFVRGDLLPHFSADSSVNPSFIFDSLGGHRFLLAFIGTIRADLGRALAEALLVESEWLARERLRVYIVTVDRRDHDDPVLRRLVQRFTVFWDHDCAIAKLFGMDATSPNAAPGASILRLGALLVRQNLRLHAAIPVSPIGELSQRLRSAADTLPQPESECAIHEQAPVLIVPEVVDRAFCRRLIEYYEQRGGTESGFMRDVDGQTRGHLDPRTKRRKDLYIDQPELRGALRNALTGRVLPEIRKAYAYEVTRVERYMIGCYDDSDRGFFSAHRDNVSRATSHRAFALSLNLNSEDYEGGSLRFPEYGPHTYKPATGSAVVFSCSLLHEALPVTRGRRYVVLPFLYDEAGAARRVENSKFLSDGPPIQVGQLTTA